MGRVRFNHAFALGALALWATGLASGCPRPAVIHVDRLDVRSADPEAKRQFDDARARFEAGDYAEARAAMAELAKSRPAEPVGIAARVMEGRAALAMGDPEEAIAILEPIAAPREDLSDPLAAQARFYLGIARLDVGEDAEGVRDLEPFGGRLAAEDARVVLSASLAEAYVRLGNAESALRHYDHVWDESDLRHEQAWAAERGRAVALGPLSPEQARKLYDDTGGSGLAGALAGLRLAVDALKSGRVDAARELLRETEKIRKSVGWAAELPAGLELPDTGARPVASDVHPGTVGLLLPLSGKTAKVGRALLAGARLAAERYGVKLLVRDATTPAEAARGAEELAAAGVVGLVGPATTDAARAAAERAADLGIPMVALSPGGGVADPRRGIFQLFPAAEDGAREVARFAFSERGVRTFAIVRPEGTYGERMATAFRETVEELGGAVVADVSYPRTTRAFKAVVAKLPAKGWDALFLPDTAHAVGAIAPALASAGYWPGRPEASEVKGGRRIQLLLASVGLTDELVAKSGRYVDGAVAARPYHRADAAPDAAAFTSAMRATEGETPDIPAALAFDAVSLIATLGSRSGERRGVADALRRLADAPAVTGPLFATPEGKLSVTLRLVEVRGGSVVVRR